MQQWSQTRFKWSHNDWDRKARALFDLLPRDKNEMRNGTVRESQKHALEKTLINALSVNPCFKTVFLCTQNLISAALLIICWGPTACHLGPCIWQTPCWHPALNNVHVWMNFMNQEINRSISEWISYAGMVECLWEKVWINNLKFMPEKMCFSMQYKSDNRVLWRAKRSEIRLKSELSHPWLWINKYQIHIKFKI